MDTSEKNKAQHRKVDFGDMQAVENLLRGWFGQQYFILFKAIEEYNRGLPLSQMKTAEDIVSPEVFRMICDIPHVRIAMERIERICFNLEYGLCSNLKTGKIYCCESDTRDDRNGAICLFYLREDGAIVFELPALGMTLQQQNNGIYCFSKVIETEFLAKVVQNRFFVVKFSSQYVRFYSDKIYALDIAPLTNESYRNLLACKFKARRNVMLILESLRRRNFDADLGSLSFIYMMEKENGLFLRNWEDIFEKAQVWDFFNSDFGKEIFQNYYERILLEVKDFVLLKFANLKRQAQNASDDTEDDDMDDVLPSLQKPYIVSDSKTPKRFALIFSIEIKNLLLSLFIVVLWRAIFLMSMLRIKLCGSNFVLMLIIISNKDSILNEMSKRVRSCA